MTILVPPHEFEPDLIDSWKLNHIKSLSIDFATNSVNGWVNDEEVILFKFKDFGFITDNRRCTYKLTAGSVGLVIQVTKM